MALPNTGSFGYRGKTSRALPSSSCQGGQAPLGFPSFLGVGRALAPAPLPRWHFPQGRAPAYLFFRKKNSAQQAAQKVSSVFCYAHILCGGGTLCCVRNPPVRATACRRHPCHAPDVPSERMGEGTAAVPKGRRWWKDSLRGTEYPICTYRAEALSQSAQESLCGAGSPPHAGGSFFLYEKSVLRESDSLRGREREVCADSTTPPFRP